MAVALRLPWCTTHAFARRHVTTARRLDPQRIRNIGVAAHVDAGKTTVVERLLFFANKTHGMGEVHEGAATMDYLPQERERGITINSAAISFEWKGAHVNLVDTPGHFDFGFEVERSMRVMDGAVIVLDAVRGVEAQTEQVWRQAARYKVPRIVLANKMDRDGACETTCVVSMRKRLGATALCVQQPVGEWARFRGAVDLVAMRKLSWPERGGAQLGREFADEALNADELAAAAPARERLLEQLADLDDDFAAAYLGAAPVDTAAVKRALARVVLAQVAPLPGTRPGVPLVFGAALRNTGMQPLLDAVVDLLPSPVARAAVLPGLLPAVDAAAPLVALAFKIQHDAMRGALVFVRVYAGRLSARDAVRGGKVQGVLRAEASEFAPIAGGACEAGDICVVTGCDGLRTGDSLGAAAGALEGFAVPPPVFSVALELESASQEARLEAALAIATRDDPSLSCGADAETGQLLLAGVGELHLEVAVDRLRREHGLALHVGTPRVALREHVAAEAEAAFAFDRPLGGARAYCEVALKLRPLADPAAPPSVAPSPALSGELRAALVAGVKAGLSRGPTLGRPVRGVDVALVRVAPDCPAPAALRAAAAGAVAELLRSNAGVAQVLEPVLRVTCHVPSASAGAVLSELTGRRRASVLAVDAAGDDDGDDDARVVIDALAPAAEMLDFTKALRSLTGGHGSFASAFEAYDVVPEAVLHKMTM